MKDPRPLVQHVYEMQIEDYLDELRTSDYVPPIDADLFKLLHAESTVGLFDDPVHNKYINYYDHVKGDPDTTPVYCPSRIYQFSNIRHEVVLKNHLTQREEIPPCAMYIRGPDEAVSDALLSTCSEISTHQGVTDLHMDFVTCNSLKVPRLINLQCLHLYCCKLPDDFVEKILRQLFGCGESLQRLVLTQINFVPFESLLDELLEDLVAHHQRKREAGLAHLDLELRLRRFIEPTNLSEEFVEKWMERCGGINSIDYDIY